MIVTIDGEHARDFDDAMSIEQLANGHYRLGVHIADVAHYVKEGSALDRDAYERGTSVYFPERAVHMFPEELATGVCSLNPHVDRLVQSLRDGRHGHGDVVAPRDPRRGDPQRRAHDLHGRQRDPHRPGREVRARYAALVPTFELMGELFEILNRRRRQRGSVDFDLPKPEVRAGRGRPGGGHRRVGTQHRAPPHRGVHAARERDRGQPSRTRRGCPTLYRIHEVPDPLKVEEFDEFVARPGIRARRAAGPRCKPKHFQALVEKIEGTPDERPIAFLMLRTMQKARYDSVNMGHFGLAAPATPISPRRSGAIPTSSSTGCSASCGTAGERRAPEERSTRSCPRSGGTRPSASAAPTKPSASSSQWKKVRFMADKVGEAFDGYITGVAAFGLFVELVEHFVEGLVHVSSMADDYYRFIEREHAAARREHAAKVYRLGDRVRVQVVRVDLERRQIDLAVEEVLEARARRTERRPRPRSAAWRPARRREPRKGAPERTA